jgi:hypothetical protein
MAGVRDERGPGSLGDFVLGCRHPNPMGLARTTFPMLDSLVRDPSSFRTPFEVFHSGCVTSVTAKFLRGR